MKLRALFALPLVVASFAATGCAADAEGQGEEPVAGDEGELAQGSNADRYVYNGKLPHLEEPSITVALTPQTVRVTGFLPDSYDRAQLPFFVDSLQEGGRTKVAIVYPIATGSSINHQPNDYVTERVYPRRTDSSAPWGGFPFISYVNDESPYKGIAFHGPITAADREWKLIRGPVSHGCNRMQGEHVVELAHLIGVDMTSQLWPGNTILRNYRVPVKVLRGTPDTWEGKSIDVDYAASSSVRRPTTNVTMFKTWRSQDFPTWVCKIDERNPPRSGEVPADYCSRVRGLTDKLNPTTGQR
jgi:hypothetical protein